MSRLSLAVAAALLAVPASAQEGKRLAVLVGITKYHHPKLPDLDYTERDIADLRDLLAGTGYDADALLSSGKVEPTGKNVLAAVRATLKKCKKKTDMVLVALAGHGLQFDGDKTAYFCPTDADPKDKATLVSLPALIEEMDASFAGVKLMLVDACRNDPGKSHGADPEGIRPPKGVAARFACKAGEKAWESKKFGGGHGAFFFHVLEGLRGKAKDSDGDVTFTGLADYVKKRVPRKRARRDRRRGDAKPDAERRRTERRAAGADRARRQLDAGRGKEAGGADGPLYGERGPRRPASVGDVPGPGDRGSGESVGGSEDEIRTDPAGDLHDGIAEGRNRPPERRGEAHDRDRQAVLLGVVAHGPNDIYAARAGINSGTA